MMVSKNANDLYAKVVQRLPIKERLRLAALILEGVVKVSEEADEQNAWSQEDLQDLSKISLWYGTQTNTKT